MGFCVRDSRFVRRRVGFGGLVKRRMMRSKRGESRGCNSRNGFLVHAAGYGHSGALVR
jgi:hypothetical protein